MNRAQSGTGTTERGTSGLSAGELKILREIHRDNEAEMEMGKMATERSTNQAIIDYGQRLITDHEEADQKIWDLAGHDNQQIDDQPQSAQERKDVNQEKSEEQKLKGKIDADFDRNFAVKMVDDHKKAISKLEQARQNLPSDSSVVSLIDAVLPVLRKHQEIAESLAR